MEKGAELVPDFFEDNGFVELQRFQVRDDLREQELGMWILRLGREELTMTLRVGGSHGRIAVQNGLCGCAGAIESLSGKVSKACPPE